MLNSTVKATPKVSATDYLPLIQGIVGKFIARGRIKRYDQHDAVASCWISLQELLDKGDFSGTGNYRSYFSHCIWNWCIKYGCAEKGLVDVNARGEDGKRRHKWIRREESPSITIRYRVEKKTEQVDLPILEGAESDISQLLCRGRTHRQIRDLLGISCQKIGVTVQSLRSKVKEFNTHV